MHSNLWRVNKPMPVKLYLWRGNWHLQGKTTQHESSYNRSLFCLHGLDWFPGRMTSLWEWCEWFMTHGVDGEAWGKDRKRGQERKRGGRRKEEGGERKKSPRQAVLPLRGHADMSDWLSAGRCLTDSNVDRLKDKLTNRWFQLEMSTD